MHEISRSCEPVHRTCIIKPLLLYNIQDKPQISPQTVRRLRELIGEVAIFTGNRGGDLP